MALEDLNDEIVLEHIRTGRYVRDLAFHAPEHLEQPDFYDRCDQLGGKSALIAAIQDTFHRKHGAQMRVQKEVTDDLLLTDLGKVEFDEIPWPYNSIELWFEDPTLPTVLVSRAATEVLNKMVEGVRFSDVPGGVRVVVRMQSKEGLVLVHNVHVGMWEDLMKHGTLPLVPGPTSRLDPLEDAAMRYMLILALKVFAYASLPKYKPEKVGEVTRKMGGKPGLYNRPKRPAVRIVYLPEVHSARAPAEQERLAAGKRIMRERRGHFRHFRSDYFIHKKGTRTFIPPFRRTDLPPTHATRALVRKPTV
jgi:hypothetical protein